MELRQGSYGPDGRWHDAPSGLSNTLTRSALRDTTSSQHRGMSDEQRRLWSERLSKIMNTVRQASGAVMRGPGWPR